MERLEEERSALSFKQIGNRKTFIIIGIIAVIVGFVIGILIGVYGVNRADTSNEITSTPQPQGVFLKGVKEKIVQDGDPAITQKIIDLMKPENIRENLWNLTFNPHLAGTPADKRQAKQLVDLWDGLGFDETELTPYTILLSYPNETDPNQVFFINSTGDSIFSSNIAEEILSDKENKSDVVLPFNAYSPKGDIRGDLIYVNYARAEDFAWLAENTQINITGKLVIARYGKIFRGDKVNIASRHGAAGVILYSDPIDYTWGNDTMVYPDDWWLPGTGVQRGSILLSVGDPLTPGYPSIDSAYRYLEKDASLPQIPCHAIGYNDAEVLLRQLGGNLAPEGWRGKLNVSYNLGGLVDPASSVHLHVTTYLSRRTTYNAIGIIKGEIEPDRYVILGNHRDAWVFGAIDPSSGTAALMEVSRVFGELLKEGWRPRRSLMFCSWGAEEYGLHGSTEWVEQYIKALGERAVAYLNVDISVQGNHSLTTKATPLLYKAIYQASKKIPTADQEGREQGKTLYDTYLEAFEATDNDGNKLGKPSIGTLGAGSDYAPFLQRIGIPCIDARYTYDSKKMKLGSYPLYHSAYETFYAVNQLIDRGFHCHTAVANFWAETARNLAESLILPFNVTDYGVDLIKFKDVLYEQYGQLMSETGGINLYELSNATDLFLTVAKEFQSRLENVDRNNPLLTRMVNDQMIQLERAFTDPAGLPDRPLYKHLVFAPSSVNTYAGASFPGIADALFDIEKSEMPDERWEVVKHHYSVVVFVIQSAASTLKDVTKFIDHSS